MILVAIIKEIPFPMPLSEICSPSHIKKTVPVTIERIATIAPKMLPDSISPADCKVTVRAVDCINANTTVPYLVYCVILLRPACPSFFNSCK